MLNMLLLPRFGLLGAIVATAIGNAVSLGLILYFSKRLGLAVDRGVVLCCCLPVTLAVSPSLALAALVSLAFLATSRSWLFDAEEKKLLRETAEHYLSRLHLFGGKRPATSV